MAIKAPYLINYQSVKDFMTSYVAEKTMTNQNYSRLVISKKDTHNDTDYHYHLAVSRLLQQVKHLLIKFLPHHFHKINERQRAVTKSNLHYHAERSY